MKFTALARFVAVASAIAPACHAFAIRPFNRFVKREIYDVPEAQITGLSLNTSSSPTFDFAAGSVSVDGNVNLFIDFSSTDDSVTYDTLQVEGYYVYSGSTDDKNVTQVACGSLTGPISVNSSQPLEVPVTISISNVSLSHPILIDVASLCLGSQGGEILTVWGGWLGATVEEETYRCPLPKTNVTIPCPSSPLQSPNGENSTCSFTPEAPLPPASAESSTSSAAPSETTSSETTSSEEPTSTTTEPAASSSATGIETPSETSSQVEVITPTESTTDPAATGSTVTPTEATTVSPDATPTATSLPDGTTISPVPVIVTVTETQTATAIARRRRQF